MTGIYKITNKLNGKSYIGQSIHCGKRLDEHCKGNQLIDEIIQIDGIENFSFEILKQTTKEELSYWEDYYIIQYNTMFPNGYNKKWNTVKEIRNDILLKQVKVENKHELSKEEIEQIEYYYKNFGLKYRNTENFIGTEEGFIKYKQLMEINKNNRGTVLLKLPDFSYRDKYFTPAEKRHYEKLKSLIDMYNKKECIWEVDVEEIYDSNYGCYYPVHNGIIRKQKRYDDYLVSFEEDKIVIDIESINHNSCIRQMLCKLASLIDSEKDIHFFSKGRRLYNLNVCNSNEVDKIEIYTLEKIVERDISNLL